MEELGVATIASVLHHLKALEFKGIGFRADGHALFAVAHLCARLHFQEL